MEITNAAALATISLHGGQVISYKLIDGFPILWNSHHCYHEMGKALRGGIPICWPWFGRHPSDPDKPAHGFARTSLWQVVSTESVDYACTRIQLRLTDNETTRTLWAYQFQLEILITVGKQLGIEFIIRNQDMTSFVFTGALHSYFKVEDVTRVSIDGLEGQSYIDLLDPSEFKLQQGPLTIHAETDRIYLDTTNDCIINDPVLKRKIRISKKGSQSTVVWNPWIDKAKRMKDFGDDEYQGMVCVETTNTHTDTISITPQQEHRLQTIISVEALA